MVKRPQGLKKASKSKKLRTDEPDADAAPDAQVTIEVDDDEDPDDELNQLFALYKTYANTSLDEDRQRSPKLLHGIIHESDRLLRAAEGADLGETFHNVYAQSLLELSRFAGFGLDEDANDGNGTGGATDRDTSGGADGGKATGTDTPLDFALAGLDRVETGLSLYPESVELLFTRAKARLLVVKGTMMKDALIKEEAAPEDYVRYSSTVGDIELLLEDYVQAENLALATNRQDLLLTRSQHEMLELLLVIADIQDKAEQGRISALGELAEGDGDEDVDQDAKWLEVGSALEGCQSRIYEWVRSRYEQVLGRVEAGKGKAKTPEEDGDYSHSTLRRAHLGLGNFYLRLSSPLILRLEMSLDDDDDDEDEEEDGTVAEMSEEESGLTAAAKEVLTKSIDHLVKAQHDNEPEAYSSLAEAKISLANLLENDSEDQHLLYSEAALVLKRAQRLGYGDYQEQIAELLGESE